MLILTGLVLVAAPMLTAEASASTSGGRRSPTGTTGSHASSTMHAGSDGTDATSTAPDPAPASTHHAVDPSQTRNGGNDGALATPDPTTQTGSSSSGHHVPGGGSSRPGHDGRGDGSSSPGHHRSSGGSRHSGNLAQPKAVRGPSGTTSRAAPVAGRIGRVDPPAPDVRDAADGRRGAQSAVVASRPPRLRRTDGFGVPGSVEQVAGALRFPASLLGVILLFLALQQRADRRDPKLAKAPIAAGQEMLEFR